MTPILRTRKVLRIIGANGDQADEFADAISDYPGRRELQLMLDEMFARWLHRIMFGIIVVVSLAVGVIAVLIAALG